jgi:hypothetical protein
MMDQFIALAADLFIALVAVTATTALIFTALDLIEAILRWFNGE